MLPQRAAGYLTGGSYQRCPSPGGGKRVNRFRRYRVQALQLYRQALDASAAVAARFERLMDRIVTVEP